jgi:5'-nucleotidase
MKMKVLLTNDDGVHSQGIIQLARTIRADAEVFLVAPNVEQSGVSQAITFLAPLVPIALGSDKDSQDDQIPGYSVNGTPVDCVKLALAELCPWKPDVVISGINGGLNAGVNVSYSGTVGAALAASTFGMPAFAVSLEMSKHMDFCKTAEIVWPLIKEYAKLDLPHRTVINLNVPARALTEPTEVVVVPIETNPMGYHFRRGIDPKGREYFWSTNDPLPEVSHEQTDTQALSEGKITVSVIANDLNGTTETIDIVRNGSPNGCVASR